MEKILKLWLPTFTPANICLFPGWGETLNDAFGIPIIEGGIYCLLRRFAQKSTPIYQMIKQCVQDREVVGTDESGVRVNGCKHLFWTWQTPFFTNIAHSNNRGARLLTGNSRKDFHKAFWYTMGGEPK